MLSLRLFILRLCNFIIKLYLQFRLYLPQYFYCCADFLHRLYSLLRVSLCSRLAFTNILLFDLAQDCPLLDVPCLTAFYKDTGNLYCIGKSINILYSSFISSLVGNNSSLAYFILSTSLILLFV